MSELIQVRKKAQVTLPQSLRQALNIEEGDFLDAMVKDGEIVLRVKKLVDKDQAWFWTKEWQDASGALHAQTIETGIVSTGFQIGNSVFIGGASTVEPWLGAQLDWVGINKVVDDVTGTIFDDPYTDLRLRGGLNFAFGANAQLALTGEISGLLYEDSDTYTAGANFSFQF